MLRVSSETVKTLAVCWKKSAVSCIPAINLTTEIVGSAEFILFCATIVGRLHQTPVSFLATWRASRNNPSAYEDAHFSCDRLCTNPIGVLHKRSTPREMTNRSQESKRGLQLDRVVLLGRTFEEYRRCLLL